MKRDPIATFHEKIGKHRIRGNKLAEVSGKSASNISEILNGKVVPKVDNLVELVEAADRLSPGFADDYYLSLAGQLDVNRLVDVLSYDDLCLFMICAGQKFGRTFNSGKPVAA